MSLFDWLLVAHLVGDFLLQTPGMARGKEESWGWLAVHVALYMLPLSAVLGGYIAGQGLPRLSLMTVAVAWFVLAGSHALLDRRGFTRWWMRHILGVSSDHWLSVAVDQVFHIVILALVAQALALAGAQGMVG